MGIAAMILGIISIITLLIAFILNIVIILPIGSSVSVVGLILSIVVLVKSKPNKRMAVTAVAMCSPVIIFLTYLLIMFVAGPPDNDLDLNPSWSPDGSHIAFLSDRDGNCEIYVMDADGSNQQRLTTHLVVEGDDSSSP